MHVLLVEDDAPLAETTARALRAQGWHVDVTDRAEPVARSVAQDDYDLVILDIGLPGIDGFEALRQLRAQGSLTPVLMLTARDTVDDRVQGLEGGADDYVVKPFAVRELIARVRALQRRAEARPGDGLTLGRLRLDVAARGAFIDGKRVALSLREFTVLQYLVGKAGKVVSREQITALVEGWNAATTDNALDLLASRLRAKIEPAGLVLRTVRGLGYLIDVAEAA